MPLSVTLRVYPPQHWHMLHDIAGFVCFSVMVEPDFSVLARWNAGDRIDFRQPVAQVVGVATAICDDGAAFGGRGLKALS